MGIRRFSLPITAAIADIRIWGRAGAGRQVSAISILPRSHRNNIGFFWNAPNCAPAGRPPSHINSRYSDLGYPVPALIVKNLPNFVSCLKHRACHGRCYAIEITGPLREAESGQRIKERGRMPETSVRHTLTTILRPAECRSPAAMREHVADLGPRMIWGPWGRACGTCRPRSRRSG